MGHESWLSWFTSALWMVRLTDGGSAWKKPGCTACMAWMAFHLRYGILGLFHWVSVKHHDISPDMFTQLPYWFHQNSSLSRLFFCCRPWMPSGGQNWRKSIENENSRCPLKRGVSGDFGGWGMLIHTLSHEEMQPLVEGGFQGSWWGSQGPDVRRWQKRWLMLHVKQLSKRRALSKRVPSG